MIRFFDQAALAEYRRAGDPLRVVLCNERAAGLTSEIWLLSSEAKRLVTWTAYLPLLRTTKRLRVLDVGAGFSSLSYALASRHDYTVAEWCAHDEPPDGIETYVGDWWDMPQRKWDVVVAVDLFPNVDQRLDAFLRRFNTPHLRLVLTTYEDRWYRTRRDDADEVLTTRAWDWETTRRTLARHLYVDGILPPTRSLFPNGRQVCLVTR